MRYSAFAIAFVLLFSQQVGALSCMRTSIEDSFNLYSESTETYIMVLGKLVNKRAIVPAKESTATGEARGESYTADFIGQMATRSGFDREVKLTVAVSGTCAAVWCGRVSSDVQMLGFLQETPYGYKLTDGPCGGAVFYNVDKQMKRKALRCMRGGVCKANNR